MESSRGGSLTSLFRPIASRVDRPLHGAHSRVSANANAIVVADDNGADTNDVSSAQRGGGKRKKLLQNTESSDSDIAKWKRLDGEAAVHSSPLSGADIQSFLRELERELDSTNWMYDRPR